MPTYTLVGTATGANNTTTSALTPTMPSYAEGDLAIFIGWARTNTETVTAAPSGYTLLEAAATGFGSGANLNVYGKICTASETAPSITFSGTNRHLAVMLVLRSSTGWPAIGTVTDIVVNTTETRTSATSAGAAMRANDITPAEDNCCVLAVNGKVTTINDTTSIGTPSSYTAGAAYIYNSASAGGIIGAWFLGQTTATALLDEDTTISPTDDTGRNDQVTLALRGNAATSISYFQYQSRLNPLLRM